MKKLSMLALCCLVGCVVGEESELLDEESTDLTDVVERHSHDGAQLPNHLPIRDESGWFASVSSQGFIDLDNAFFADLGTNGRRCVSCHVPTAGWTITPEHLRRVFDATRGGLDDDGFGLGAVFRTNDGSNAPNADVSTLKARRRAYSMLLDRGLIRVGLPIPANAEFELIAVDDPYRFASAAELSLFRRPLPTANLKFDSTVMWDGREMVEGQTIEQILRTQANSATVGHAQGAPLAQADRESIAQFQLALVSAQIYDRKAHDLDDDGARGGPDAVLAQEFYIGINDNFGDSRTGAPFTPVVFDLYDAWAAPDSGRHRDHHTSEARRAVARGQALFNTKPIRISGVSGINDEPIFGSPPALVGTCTTCHNTPNGGNHSVTAPLDIGLVDEARRTRDMPLYTLRNKATGELKRVTDPGRAMISGKWKHIGRFKGPMLRNLAARAPYFHNGFAKDLAAAVSFYDERFAIGLTRAEKADLVAFLRTL